MYTVQLFKVTFQKLINHDPHIITAVLVAHIHSFGFRCYTRNTEQDVILLSLCSQTQDAQKCLGKCYFWHRNRAGLPSLSHEIQLDFTETLLEPD